LLNFYFILKKKTHPPSEKRDLGGGLLNLDDDVLAGGVAVDKACSSRHFFSIPFLDGEKE
jgi:hypothetical protein